MFSLYPTRLSFCSSREGWTPLWEKRRESWEGSVFLHDKHDRNYFTRFRPGWPFEGFPSLLPSFFSRFSLKRVFFRLTALMMQ